jgi:hypothetical protein
MIYLYRHLDRSNEDPFICVDEQYAVRYNLRQYGIFQSVQSFKSEVRQIVNLDKIVRWSVEIDDIPKREQVGLIYKSPLMPSLVLESTRGYHIFFNAIEATVENFSDIQTRLVDFFNGDEKACDLARVLRKEGYFNWKLEKPFMVNKVFQRDVAYSEPTMLKYFPAVRELLVVKKPIIKTDYPRTDFYKFIDKLDNMEALQLLSGSDYVNCENYSFKLLRSGNHNIFVDGKGTSCFIDKSMKIGSMSSGGPTVIQWLEWYGHKKDKAVDIVKELYRWKQ